MSTTIEVNDATEAEAERLSKRDSLRRKLAEIEVKRERIRDLRDILVKIDDDVDRADAEHQAATAPLQGELDGIDQRHIDSIVGNVKPTAKDATRRRALLEELNAANQRLEDAVESNKRARRKIEKQIHGLEMGCTHRTVYQNDLARTASPALLDRGEVLQSRQRWAGRRLKAAAEALENSQTNLRIARQQRPNAAAAYESRLRLCELESEDARRQAAESTTAMDALRRRMLDE